MHFLQSKLNKQKNSIPINDKVLSPFKLNISSFLFKFEERKYQGGQNWVSHKKNFKINTEKKAQNDMFMSLFNYITGKNETGN